MPAHCQYIAGQEFYLVAESNGVEFSVGLNDADRNYHPDEGGNVHSNHFFAVDPTEGTKMLHSSTDGGISFPDMPDEWTTDATRPPHMEEDFLINVGLHVNCEDYAPGAKAIALGNYHESVGSWVVNGDGTISPQLTPHLVLGWGDWTAASCWTSGSPNEPNNLVLLDAASPAGPVFRACGGASTDYEGPCTENCVACDGPGYEDCLECKPGYAHYDEDGDGGGSCWPECRGQTACYADGR